MIFNCILYYWEYLFQLFARPNYPFMLNLVLDKLCPKLNWASLEKKAFIIRRPICDLGCILRSPHQKQSIAIDLLHIFWKRQINGDDDNEKDVFKSLTQAVRKKKSECSQHRSQTYDLLVTSQDALPLSYIKTRGSSDKHPAYGLRSSRHQRNRHQQVDSSPTNNSEIIDTV